MPIIVPSTPTTGGLSSQAMTYLALAQRLRRKCRVSGSGPSAISGQSEEYQRLLDFINEAWMFIQLKHTDWRWMRKSATCTTKQGQNTYSPSLAADFNLIDFGHWALDYQTDDTFRNYVTSVGPQSEIFMPIIDYDLWRDRYLYGANRFAYSRPLEIALAPDNSLACGPIPVAGYTLSGDYYAVPSQFAAAGDVPGMPSQYHMAIVYKAMMFYGTSENAPEVYDDGEKEFTVIMGQLERAQLRRMSLGGALA